MSSPDPNLRCLATFVKETSQKASDLEWDGGDASPLWAQVAAAKIRIERGELFEPLF